MFLSIIIKPCGTWWHGIGVPCNHDPLYKGQRSRVFTQNNTLNRNTIHS